MIQQRLPDGWRWIKLGDFVTKIGSGVTPRGGHASYIAEGVPLIRSQNIHMNRFEYDGLAFISDEQDRQMQSSRVQQNDVLLNITGASIGRVCVVPGEVCPANVNQHVSIIRTNGSIDPRYLAYYISYPDFQKFIMDSEAGATRQALTKTLIEDFQIPLPPLPEQQRIAEIIEEQMADIDAARIAIEAELEAAESLTASYLREVFESDEARDQFKLGDVLIRSTEIIHPHDNPKGIATFVGLEHIESGTGKRIGSLEVEMSELTGRKPMFYEGQLVYGYLRPYLNKVWVAEFDGLCSVDQYIYSINSDLAVTDYIFWFMLSPVYIERSPVGSNTSQLPRIRLEEVAAVDFGLPSLEDQQRIVRDIQCAVNEINHACTALRERLQAVNLMPAAVLRRAFNGEL